MAALLRATPQPGQSAILDHQPQALVTAIGLDSSPSADSALGTWIFALIYAARYQAEALISPGLTALDFCTRFLTDPAAFCTLAHGAAVAAGVLSVLLVYLIGTRLIDHWVGVAAAFAVSLHPAAVALSHRLDSAAFALLFLLLGILTAIPWRREQSHPAVVAVAAGLSLGFATDALPLVAALALFGSVMLIVHRAPQPGRLSAVAPAGLAIACFLLGATLVIPPDPAALAGYASTALTPLLMAAGLGCAMIYLLRHLRNALPANAWSSALLGAALVFTAGAADGPAEPPSTPLTPAAAASQWMADNLPDRSTVVVHPSLHDDISLPRTARSWLRELQSDLPARRHSHVYAAVALHAAAASPRPAWHVILAPSANRRDLLQQLEAASSSSAAYVVVPAHMDLEANKGSAAAPGSLWLVAKFRPAGADQPGVAIWAPRSPQTHTPTHVHWIRRGDRRLARCHTGSAT
ncbi:MAG: hypothetical protein ACP5KN_13400 [Armatimonadota bacterium]